jgi:ArsR family transcriptional regulator
MGETNYEHMSETLRVLGHPVRLRMLAGILKDECSVAQIQKKMGLPQSTVSQHLSVLRNRGIIRARREGTKRCYTVIDATTRSILRRMVKE